MQDTSFAIHPGKERQLKGTVIHDIGNFLSVRKEDDHFAFQCENGFVNVEFHRDDIVRVVMNPSEKPLMGESFTVEKKNHPIKVKWIEEYDKIELTSTMVKVVIKKKPFRVSIYDHNGYLLVSESEKGMSYDNDKKVVCYKDATEDDHYYGFGEKTGFLDKRGEKYTMWNSDVYAPHNPETDPLYQSIPYFMTLRNGRATGIFFDNTFKTVFDMRVEDHDTYSFQAEGGQLDYYFLAGPTPEKVVEQYTSLTGKMPLPPKWGLGYHQSRYSYETEQEVREVANHFLEKGIPLDAIHFDIHYMNGYRVFTFDENRFPDAKKLITELKDKGIRAVPIVDPGVKADPEYEIYQEGIQNNLFCKYIEGNIYYGDVWPGNSAFPDFTKEEARKWWGEKHKFYVDKGIEGIWNDMNEPAVFNETKTMDVTVLHDNDGKPKFHRELHNVYGYLMGEATYHGMKDLLSGKRPFLLTRAGYAGVQKYAAVWTGDNRSFWEHLEMAIPMCLNLGVSGVTFSGPDVGGFAHDSNGELLARWTQFGAFTPYFRNHSAMDTHYQEPWAFGEKYEAIIKKYIRLRYKWLQHLYKLFKDASETGIPVMRPLFMEFPEDTNTYQLSDQFLIGKDVLVAPILRPGVTDRIVYLPEGEWYDYWTDELYSGGTKIMVHAELDTLPIFIKKGAIIPEAEVTSSTAKAVTEMTVHLYPDTNVESNYQLYDDDGQTFEYETGKYFALDIHVKSEGTKISVNAAVENKKYEPYWKQVTYKIHGVLELEELIYNGEKIDKNSISYDAASNTITFSHAW